MLLVFRSKNRASVENQGDVEDASVIERLTSAIFCFVEGVSPGRSAAEYLDSAYRISTLRKLGRFSAAGQTCGHRICK